MSDESSNYWQRSMGRRVSRRSALRGTAVAGLGLAGAALIGCGGGDEEKATPAATKAAGATGAATPVAAAAEQPQPGGTFINPVTTNVADVLDPHTSLAIAWGHWVWMGNTAIRRSRDGAKLEPQLVESWEDRKSTRLNSSHIQKSRMPSSA